MKKIALLAVLSLFLGCAQSQEKEITQAESKDLSKYERAYFASGCFWCVEAIYESVEGVEEVISGYSGGSKGDATYKKVSSGSTNHAEAVEVFYDPEVITYKDLVIIFFGSHDPTTRNQQGPDRGPQYRSAIFYQNEIEKKIAQDYMELLRISGEYKSAITTELSPLDVFYPAESYHQNYERLNPNQPYVRSVSVPRLNEFKSNFPNYLKEQSAH